jgi:hypothetical protein
MAVVELHPTEASILTDTIEESIGICEQDGGEVTGYAFVVFVTDGKKQRGSLMRFRVDDIVEAAGAVEILKHRMVASYDSDDADDGTTNGAA